ncbi:hypothetical protein F2Q69_00019726 [Brassica cretica]|uniref:RNase H type-1 domain-containing protein n=1 Tax=Brassica cretica TaxID=69181 RepID=A0A8S9QE23_BRACR|nr:hypothetical protein F2Q69_00019726 [Brassica cretica]
MVWTVEALCDIKISRVLLESSVTQWSTTLDQASVPINLLPLWRRLRRAMDQIETNRVTVIQREGNRVASSIAFSALQVQWQQSNVATNGPVWLHPLIRREAARTV